MRASIFPLRFGLSDYKNDNEKIERRQKLTESVLKPKLGMLSSIISNNKSKFQHCNEADHLYVLYIYMS